MDGPILSSTNIFSMSRVTCWCCPPVRSAISRDDMASPPLAAGGETVVGAALPSKDPMRISRSPPPALQRTLRWSRVTASTCHIGKGFRYGQRRIGRSGTGRDGMTLGIDLALVASDKDARRFHLWDATPIDYSERLHLQNELTPRLNRLERFVFDGDGPPSLPQKTRFEINSVSRQKIDEGMLFVSSQKVTTAERTWDSRWTVPLERRDAVAVCLHYALLTRMGRAETSKGAVCHRIPFDPDLLGNPEQSDNLGSP